MYRNYYSVKKKGRAILLLFWNFNKNNKRCQTTSCHFQIALWKRKQTCLLPNFVPTIDFTVKTSCSHEYSILRHSNSSIYYFLSFTNNSYATLMAVVLLYFVRYIHDSTVLIFRTLYSFEYCPYILYAIFIALVPSFPFVKSGDIFSSINASFKWIMSAFCIFLFIQENVVQTHHVRD